MRFFEHTVISGKIQFNCNKLPFILLALKLLLIIVPVLSIGCATTRQDIENDYATSIFYFDTSDDNYLYQLFKKSYGAVWKKKDFILEINKPVASLGALINPEITSFTIANMPLDVLDILKSFQPNDDSYTDYYDYVERNVDRIILYPHIKGALGFSMNTYKDIWPYESESLIYVDSYYLKNSLLGSTRENNAAVLIVHEAAHKELSRLVEEEKISYKYNGMNLSERYALIKEVEFREKINWQDKTGSHISSLIRYNRFYGLSDNDRTLFILEE